MPGRASPDGTQLRGFTPPLPPPVHYPTPTPPPPAARASPVSRDGEDDCTAGSGAETGGDAWRRSAALEEVEQVVWRPAWFFVYLIDSHCIRIESHGRLSARLLGDG
mmetsp:Transcript_40262/g.107973  ORF Transcript_40262/g.107973 Transcript_40262/m.107973 type:complete len:107 (-) Transcript_40262:830-1150(-)